MVAEYNLPHSITLSSINQPLFKQPSLSPASKELNISLNKGVQTKEDSLPQTLRQKIKKEASLDIISSKQIIKNHPVEPLQKKEEQDEIMDSSHYFDSKKLEPFHQAIERRLQFSVDTKLGVTIVKVVDSETNELIRQFPAEEWIDLSHRLKKLNEPGATLEPGILLEETV
jgi:flagellar protein FlaG